MNFIKGPVQQRVLVIVLAATMFLAIGVSAPSHSLAEDSSPAGRGQNRTTSGGVPTNPSIVPANDSATVSDVPATGGMPTKTGGVPTNSTKVPPVDR